ncbi:glycoside hydrolase family 6 protein [Actinoplanes sp. NPDC049596]|uniref:glycoside hydrolase family 6 protein n=1 Tax=unclassified Actinoplanes TaxID=2626549 RepID=UPI0034453B89
MRRRYVLFAAFVIAAGIATPMAISAARTDPAPDAVQNEEHWNGRLTGQALYVDPTGAAANEVRALETAGRTADARIIRRIADRPTATWFADAAPGYADRARQLVADAGRAGKLPVLTLYHIPNRDCSGHSAGGAPDAAAYRQWISSLASALRGRRSVVVLEPDAVAQTVRGCLDSKAAAERLGLLSQAVATLRANPGTLVYLDAGNPTWIRKPAQMSAALRRAGVQRASGFALNVANFERTADNIRYGTSLSKQLQGAHFVIDTSRNGNGPAKVGAGDHHWCNPAGRKLGEAPTTRTGQALVDAYLWVKRPGESDGACSPGAPPAGQWWYEYARALAS